MFSIVMKHHNITQVSERNIWLLWQNTSKKQDKNISEEPRVGGTFLGY